MTFNTDSALDVIMQNECKLFLENIGYKFNEKHVISTSANEPIVTTYSYAETRLVNGKPEMFIAFYELDYIQLYNEYQQKK